MENNYSKLDDSDTPYTYCSSCNGDITTKNDIGEEYDIWIICKDCKSSGIKIEGNPCCVPFITE
jgi:hypothetical protein